MTDVRPVADVISRRLDSGAVLVHVATSRIFELNETGRVIWEQLGRGLSPSEIAAQLVREFDVDETEAGNQVSNLLEQLCAEGLLA